MTFQEYMSMALSAISIYSISNSMK